MIDAIARYYTEDNANVHRGVHLLSERATRGLRGRADEGRSASSTPRDAREIVFTRGTTESINLVAQS